MLKPFFLQNNFLRLLFLVGLLGVIGLLHLQIYGLPDHIPLPFHPPPPPPPSSRPPSPYRPDGDALHGALQDANSSLEHFESERSHPIDELIQRSHATFDLLLSEQTHSVSDAAAAYRRRRGRHPPPDFDKWHAFAQERDVVMIEDLFDRIYHDLTPFWALPASHIRTAAASSEFVISIRNGKATKRSDGRPWLNLWHDMFRTIQKYLPDADFACNELDEPRLLVQWEKIDTYVAIANARKNASLAVADPHIESNFSSLPPCSRPVSQHLWNIHGPVWHMAREACPPYSAARKAKVNANYTTSPEFPATWPAESYQGYVLNFTSAKNPCVHPHLREQHGSFVEPISINTTNDIFPIFSGAKLSMNNDILIPSPMYWVNDEFYSVSNGFRSWDSKKDKIIWRGDATGGRNRAENWRRFHRHRFVSMLNSSQIRATQEARLSPAAHDEKKAQAGELEPPEHISVQAGHDWLPHNFPLPDSSLYRVGAAHQTGGVSSWMGDVADAAFDDLVCFPAENNGRRCSYTDPWYEVKSRMSLSKQYQYKYMPDIDDNSFSGRYRGLLRSHSLPIKSTIYSEWHDDRLIPWKHFVPMDNTFMDFWGIMDYFLGDGNHGGHDEAARKIAEDGREWAGRVLRKEDMLVYLYRVALEYARVSDDRRHNMGYVADLE